MDLKHSEKRIIERVFDLHTGYVLNFTNRTFSEWFDDEFGITIFDDKYSYNGSSKGKYLRAFIEVEDGSTVGKVLRSLWSYYEKQTNFQPGPQADMDKKQLFEIIAIIEDKSGSIKTDAIEKFKKDETLDELINTIQRDISANKPAVALDRLHLYCMKKFSHLLDERNIDWTREEPLHSRVGKYVKVLEKERDLRKISLKVIKSSIGIFDDLNDIRNNCSFAHDNDLVDQAEARFIFDAISAILRFVKAVDTVRYGA
ncbi:abortive infection family protein [Methylobacterium indicum]|uniref:Abortive infection protein n=1 Tax=Methylobacterium indicum TaxID=1775910 RepID=A0A8H8X0Y9_9HYPH|nr:abortive infection family protein [Methylobacterium indicum]BCM88064.1 abortive infection protein [Methylobacterium indicum]